MLNLISNDVNLMVQNKKNINNEFENLKTKIMSYDIYKYNENENILYIFIVYSLFFGVFINIYEYTESNNIKLLFSSEKTKQLYDLLKDVWPKDIITYNIIIYNNFEKTDFGYHSRRINNNIIFTSNNILQS